MKKPCDMFMRSFLKIVYLLGLTLLLLNQHVGAQTVALTGMLGARALLIVDGAPPKSVAAGETYKGVKVISTQGDVAVLEIGGKQQSVRVGDAPAQVGASKTGANGSRVVLSVGSLRPSANRTTFPMPTPCWGPALALPFTRRMPKRRTSC